MYNKLWLWFNAYVEIIPAPLLLHLWPSSPQLVRSSPQSSSPPSSALYLVRSSPQSSSPPSSALHLQVYFQTGNGAGNPLPHLNRVFDYVLQMYPFYNKTGGSLACPDPCLAYFTQRPTNRPPTTNQSSNRPGGKDHFFWLPGDFGACHMPSRFMDRPIKVSLVSLAYFVRNSLSPVWVTKW